jgi:hypothetical protein
MSVHGIRVALRNQPLQSRTRYMSVDRTDQGFSCKGKGVATWKKYLSVPCAAVGGRE